MRLEQLTRNPSATFPDVLHDLIQKLRGKDVIVNREIRLRGYQADCINKIAHSYGSGHRAPILQLVTGAGKTVIFADITRRASLKGTTTLVLAHRVELIRQASAKLGDAGVAHGIIGPQFEPSPEHSVQVGSVQTVVRRLDRMPKFGLIILDECFPAGTLIDGKPIENIRTGAMVRTFEPATRTLTYGRVVRLFRRRTDCIVRVRFVSGRDLVATPNHPVFTRKGWVNAGSIVEGCSVYIDTMHRMREHHEIPNREQVASLSTFGQSVLLGRMQENMGIAKRVVSHDADQSKACIQKDDRTQPHEIGGGASEDERDTFTDEACPAVSGREWQTHAIATTGASDRSRTSVEGRARCESWPRAAQWMADELQDRPGILAGNDRCRGGRGESLFDRATESRCQEELLSEVDRVVSVEIFKRGSSSEFDSLCPGGLVFNFEVEGTNTYFAGGVAVHNCHHAVSPTYRKILESQPQAKVLGVTATPERLDGKGLGIQGGGPFDDLIVGPPVDELIAGGFLTPARVFAPAHGPDLRSVRTRAGDYARDDLAGAMGQPSIIGDAVEHYRRHADGLAAIAFCVSVDHGQETAQAFRSAGYRSVCVHGDMPADERDRAIGGLATGEIQVLTSCDLVSEGLDVPAVGAVILLRPTKSLGLYLQMVGRGLRPAPGKSNLVILDHAGNVSRHGFIEDHRQWSLNGQQKRAPGRQMSLMRCPRCGSLHRTGPACPVCGFAQRQPRQVNAIEGELAEMHRIQHPQSDWSDLIDKNLLRTAPLSSVLTGEDSRERLELIRGLRGYKRGWVYFMLRQQQEQRASARLVRGAA